MIRQSVSSSNLRSVGYDSDQLILEIEFHESGVYQYFGVPERVFKGLMSAQSIGSFFNQDIKDNYRYTKTR